MELQGGSCRGELLGEVGVTIVRAEATTIIAKIKQITKLDKNGMGGKNIIVQVAWTNYTVLGRGHYKLLLGRANLLLDYSQGDLVGIKSKCCGEPRSISYFFRESREVMFERVRWTRQSRGVFRLGTQDVTIKDCEIVRERPVGGMGWCLSTSDGGPQFGQPKDPYMHKVKVENFYAENTGDDSLAFFNAKASSLNVSCRYRLY